MTNKERHFEDIYPKRVPLFAQTIANQSQVIGYAELNSKPTADILNNVRAGTVKTTITDPEYLHLHAFREDNKLSVMLMNERGLVTHAYIAFTPASVTDAIRNASVEMDEDI